MLLVASALLVSHLLEGQVTVTNNEPGIFYNINRYMYRFFENPITITTGNLKEVKVSVKKGTIKKGNKPGEYYVRPDDTEYFTTTVIITATNFRKEIDFELLYITYPDIDIVGGQRTEGVVYSLRGSTGIRLIHRPVDISGDYKIDSFFIEFTYDDSIHTTIGHMNIGAEWDNSTKALLNKARSESFVLINNVYVTDPIDPQRKRLISNKMIRIL